MTLFSVAVGDPPPLLTEGRVYLRLASLNDYPVWAAERADSLAFLKPWEPTWAADDLTRAAFKRRVKRNQRDFRDGAAYPFLLFRAHDDALLGGLTLSNVRHGVAQSCSLGYWMARRHAGQGYMTEAVRAVIRYAFDSLNLHRIEAACIPGNERSLRLLEKAGFLKEGYAKSYILIDGSWRDHLLFALVNPRDLSL